MAATHVFVFCRNFTGRVLVTSSALAVNCVAMILDTRLKVMRILTLYVPSGLFCAGKITGFIEIWLFIHRVILSNIRKTNANKVTQKVRKNANLILPANKKERIEGSVLHFIKDFHETSNKKPQMIYILGIYIGKFLIINELVFCLILPTKNIRRTFTSFINQKPGFYPRPLCECYH